MKIRRSRSSIGYKRRRQRRNWMRKMTLMMNWRRKRVILQRP